MAGYPGVGGHALVAYSSRSLPTTQRLQLDCTSDRHWHIVIFFCRGPTLKPRPVLDSPTQTTRDKVPGFFTKSQNGLVTLVFKKRVFQGDFRDNRPFELKLIFSESEVYYERNCSLLNTTFKKIEESMFRTKLSLVRASTVLLSARRSA